MDDLLCDEEIYWLKTPTTIYRSSASFLFGSTKQDFEHNFAFCLRKEHAYVPRPGYVDRLVSYGLIIPRFRAMLWLIKSRSRLNLSFDTVFIAANCLDRFMSITKCQEWKLWMIELLSVACLSIASKFNETFIPSLHEIQMEDLEHSFQSRTIQRTEMMLLTALEWRVGSTTAYSYVEMFHHHVELANRVTELLLGTLLDYNFLGFRPCVIAVCALKWSVKDLFPLTTANYHLDDIYKLIPLDHKDELIECEKMMQKRLLNPIYKLLIENGHYSYCPSSPVTVLLTGRIEIHDSDVDLSVFHQIQNSADTPS